MRRFTVSLPDDLYGALQHRCEIAEPPATLQQMIRYAVEAVVAEPGAEPATEAEPTPTASATRRSLRPVDLLVFTVHEAAYGMAVEQVETVATKVAIHRVPSTSSTLIGVTGFRGILAEIHDGGVLFGGPPVEVDDSISLLAVSSSEVPVLIAASSVQGLAHADDLRWDPAPLSTPPWVVGLAWDDDRVITVIDPYTFNF